MSEPLTAEAVERIIEKERPDALLPTVGGQTAQPRRAARRAGRAEACGVELIGAQIPAIKVAGSPALPERHEGNRHRHAEELVKSLDEALALVEDTGFPAIIRPSFTMGGVGGGIAYNLEEFKEICGRGLSLSPVHGSSSRSR